MAPPRPRRFLAAGAALLWCCLLPAPAVATRHTFTSRDDGRLLIGPIGVPFGFNPGGHLNVTVADFSMAVGHRRHSHARTHEETRAAEERILGTVEAGLLLRRFRTESDFATWRMQIAEDGMCAFQGARAARGADGETDEDGGGGGGGGDDASDLDASLVDSADVGGRGIFLPLREGRRTWGIGGAPGMAHVFADDGSESGLYFLIYQVCLAAGAEDEASLRHLHEVRSTFDLDLVMRNPSASGSDRRGESYSYLTAGEMSLPGIFLLFSVGYAILTVVWMGVLSRARARVVAVHMLMGALLVVKTLSVLFESVRYHYIQITGHAEFWTAMYYAVAFVKGTFLFTVILLLGSGWSFVKPYLNDGERRIVAIVLVLQVIDNIAVVVLNAETEGEQSYDDWSAVLHLVDILCCCAVLVPIVWSVNSLERTVEGGREVGGGAAADPEDPAQAEGLAPRSGSEDAKTLEKLKLFRSFYLQVVAYVYFTRIIVYLFATMLDYQHTWMRYFVTEAGTLAFYLVVGMKFRPTADNPYLALRTEDDGEDAGRGMEMGKLGGKI